MTVTTTARRTEHRCGDRVGTALMKNCPAYACTTIIPIKTDKIMFTTSTVMARWVDFDVPEKKNLGPILQG